MFVQQKPHRASLALIFLALATLACSLNVGGSAASGAVRAPLIFLAPDSKSTVALGTTVEIAVNARDPSGAGVTSVDFTLDGAPLGSQNAPNPAGQPEFTAIYTWTVSGAQGHLLAATAYRADHSMIGEAALLVTVAALPTTPTVTPNATAAPPTPFVIVPQSSLPAQPTLTPSITTAPIFSPIPSLTSIVMTATRDPSAVSATITNPTLNVRGGPGVNYAAIGTLKAGDVVQVIGRNADTTWLVIQGADVRGWIINTAIYLRITGNVARLPLVAIPPSPIPTNTTGGGGQPLVPTSTPS